MTGVRSRMRQHAFTLFFMFAVTLVAISLVSALHLATADVVARNGELFLRNALREAAGLPPMVGSEAVDQWYTASVTAMPTHYRIEDPETGGVLACVFVRRGPGLWGNITAVIGVTADCSAVTGVTFTEHNETPGLGARIGEEWFRTQFTGKRGPFVYVDEGTRSPDPQTFDAITGATITTKAVRDILNRTMKEARGIVKGSVPPLPDPLPGGEGAEADASPLPPGEVGPAVAGPGEGGSEAAS